MRKTFFAGVAGLSITTALVADIYEVGTDHPENIQFFIDSVVVDGDVIQLDAGTYLVPATIDLKGMAITLRGKSDASGTPMSILDGQGSIRVLVCQNDEGASTVLESLHITGGSAWGKWESTDSRGGGLFVHWASPTVRNCTFTNNSAFYCGGGLCSTDSSPVLTNCVFDKNDASSGGGMFILGGSPTLMGCVFTENRGGSGAGLYDRSATSTLTNCMFAENLGIKGSSTLPVGVGMYTLYGRSTLTNCTFEGNSGYSGSAMYNQQSISLTLTNCTFVGNSSEGNGGAVVNDFNSSPTFTGCTFTNNSTNHIYSSGGGMANLFNSNPILTDCTFVGNSTGQYGGGVFNWNGDWSGMGSSPTLSDCTVSGNSASTSGGGVYSGAESSVSLFNSIVCANTPDQIGGDWENIGGSCEADDCEDRNNDTDGDGIFDCEDGCPNDPDKDDPGVCGCGVADTDSDGDGVPDCMECFGDINGDMHVSGADLGIMIALWGTSNPLADLNDDGLVDGADLGLLIGAWGPC